MIKSGRIWIPQPDIREMGLQGGHSKHSGKRTDTQVVKEPLSKHLSSPLALMLLAHGLLSSHKKTLGDVTLPIS